MVELRMENERVERLRLRQLGEAWIRAVTRGALDELGTFCQPDVHSRLLTPNRFVTFDTAVDLVAKFTQWFGACNSFTVEHSRIEMVGERLGIFVRFLLREQGQWFVVEQQLYCTLYEGRIARLEVLCSGFQPVGQGEYEASLVSRKAGEQQMEFGLLEVFTGTAGSESTCAVLTPAIKMKLRAMESGQVLEVRVDDPSARGDIEAWCRLSGNELVKVSEGEGQILSFFVKKKVSG